MASRESETAVHWFALRDLSRSNARYPAYKLLAEKQFEVYTPIRRRLVIRQGVRRWEQLPVMQDLLFAHGSREQLDPIIGKVPTLQYRYVYGGFREPMIVPDADMERFIRAVGVAEEPKFYLPEEITPAMCGRKVRIVGGPLSGYEGHLLSMRGSKTKRLLVELPNIMTAAVEVQPEMIEVLKIQ